MRAFASLQQPKLADRHSRFNVGVCGRSLSCGFQGFSVPSLQTKTTCGELDRRRLGDRPPRCAGNALHNGVSHLRKLLEPEACASAPEVLLTRPPGYLLQVGCEQLDSAQLENILEQGRQVAVRGALEEAANLLRKGERLWRGPALADFRFEQFARSEIARLEELRLLTIADRVDVELALARHALLVCELTRLVGDHPLNERFRGQLMLALYRCGRQAEALAAYRETRRVLVEELGISPSRPLQILERAILRQEPYLDGPMFRGFIARSPTRPV